MINTQKDREILVVNLQFERLDASTSMVFTSRLVEIINDGNKLIILNLENLKSVDSSGFGSIVSILKTLGQKGELFLCGIDEKLCRCFV